MASFLRGKQTGMQNDLSAGILPGSFSPDEQSRYGINSQTSCFAYEPVQSLLAVGTGESKYGPGKIYVFGQNRVQKFIQPSHPASIRQLRFVANRLISLDSKDQLAVWNLNTAERIAGFSPGGRVACLLTDPMLDWAFLGMASGDVMTYDLDRERMSPFRLPNFWKARDPKAASVSLVGLQLHPRDIGKLLIAYSHGAVIYSFKQNKPVKFLEYELPPGAPGGNSEGLDTVRRPRLSHAAWHPTGTFVLTAHQDGSLVFWDPKESKVITARSLSELNVDRPTPEPGRPMLVEPYVKIAWCCKENPDDTALLIAGGHPKDAPQKGLTFLDLGQTPLYATSTWDLLAAHFRGKRNHILQTPPGADVIDFFLVPRHSPHFAGAQDPIAVLSMLTSGETVTMSFPSGYPISPTNQLHPSLSFVHPFATRFTVSTLDRGRWLGMVETRDQGEALLKGGAEAAKPRRRYEGRNIVQVAHADGTVRIWDVGHSDEMENQSQLQVDVARALDQYEDVEITAMDMAELTGEFAAGTKSGEVVIYRWGPNKYYGRDEPKQLDPKPGALLDISSRAEPSLKEGLQPFVLYEMLQGPISAVSVSDVGFVAVGSETGHLSIVDLRGPAVIYQTSVAEFARREKKSLLKGHSSAPAAKDWPVVIEFGVMTLEGDNYSSIACFVGTNRGRLATLKLLPSGQGYSVSLAGVAQLNDRVVAICPIVVGTGAPAAATGPVVAGLRDGRQVNGTVVAVTQTEIRIFKPASAKGASKSFDDVFCDAAAVTEFELQGFAIVGVFGDGSTRAYSLPGLKEIGHAPLPMLDGPRRTASMVTCTGDVFGWTGPSEIVILPVWGGTGKGLQNSQDVMINPELAMPPRPTISNFQWVSGTQYVSPTDLDLLIGGPERPPSKRMVAAAAAEKQLARDGGAAAGSPRGGSSQEGWGQYLTRQLNERTEKLNLMSDTMDGLEEQSAGWADDVSKFVSKQKRNMLLGGITGKFF